MTTYRGLPACTCLAAWLPVFETLIGREVRWFQLDGDAPASAGSDNALVSQHPRPVVVVVAHLAHRLVVRHVGRVRLAHSRFERPNIGPLPRRATAGARAELGGTSALPDFVVRPVVGRHPFLGDEHSPCTKSRGTTTAACRTGLRVALHSKIFGLADHADFGDLRAAVGSIGHIGTSFPVSTPGAPYVAGCTSFYPLAAGVTA